MAGRARVDTELDRALGSDHILVSGHGPVFGHGRSGLEVELRVPDVIDSVTLKTRCPCCGIEHELAGPNPVGLCSECWSVPEVVPHHDRLLLLQPIDVTGRFVTGGVDRVALVDR